MVPEYTGSPASNQARTTHGVDAWEPSHLCKPCDQRLYRATLLVQGPFNGTLDTSHLRPDLDEFVRQYRQAGGQVDLALFEGEGEGFLTRQITSPGAERAFEQIIAFIHQHIG
jgi:acetyl esterase/lipase